MYKLYYSQFLRHLGSRLHFRSHSHHPWPDVTREAMLEYWDDSAKYQDLKWGCFFEKHLPVAQKHIAKILNLPEPSQIAIATSTHEFLARLLSCFPHSSPLRILTTDSEFLSAARQFDRLEEANLATIERVALEPFCSFSERFSERAATGKHDFIFISQVFFNSGYVVNNLEEIVHSITNPNTLIVIDGYQGFCAVPTDLSRICAKVFYLAGGYKYAQAGENFAFLTLPKGCDLRPINTGWYSESGLSSSPQSAGVPYPDNGFRFWGAAVDFSALYRFNAVMDLMESLKLDIPARHSYVTSLQNRFLSTYFQTPDEILPGCRLITPTTNEKRSHFLAFETSSAEKIVNILQEVGLLINKKGTRIRLGFGLYHNEHDMEEALERMKTALRGRALY